MRAFLRAHWVELATAVISVGLCSYFLVPELRHYVQIALSDRGGGTAPDGSGTVRHRRMGHVLFSGTSTREAVESKVQSIRAVYESTGVGGEDVIWDDIERTMADLAESTRAELLAEGRGIEWADLTGADLRGVDFRGISLRGVRFEEADMSDVRLAGADLGRTDFDRANLSGVDFREVSMYGRFRDTVLQGADLRGTELRDCRRSDFRGADLRDADLCLRGAGGSDLRGADLRGARLYVVPYDREGYLLPPWEPQRRYRRSRRWGPFRIDPSRMVSAEACFQGVQYDDNTRVEGLVIVDAEDIDAPFIPWALERGAVLRSLDEVLQDTGRNASSLDRATDPTEAPVLSSQAS